MTDPKELIVDFLNYCRDEQVELYNEPGLQHEMAIFLRQKLHGTGLKIQLERNVSFFTVQKTNVRKREIDIVIYTPDKSHKTVIELKYSTRQQGKVPERMFEVCEDLMFLEQLKALGFDRCFSLFLADNKDFWAGKGVVSPYKFFRPPFDCLCGQIMKPTGKDEEKKALKTVTLNHSYNLAWKDLDKSHKYILTEVCG
ncbi:hypothetical protein HNV11_11030 [Spirosoma taeanense]|uniref:Uncharacterized protein n=1 Tax=Spirosoma taeanense TaxID=2735870 RepID=A0A6M5Y9H4_9BACT|nr:hypothetical protein [Spirosoma taeanense]QJW89871.1 hypothetical protein HNV11_11030 [Spirosoma taeanense]